MRARTGNEEVGDGLDGVGWVWLRDVADVKGNGPGAFDGAADGGQVGRRDEAGDVVVHGFEVMGD